MSQKSKVNVPVYTAIKINFPDTLPEKSKVNVSVYTVIKVNILVCTVRNIKGNLSCLYHYKQ